jgi:hypothetical protein
MPLTRQYQGFGGPKREMRSISRADKLWVERGMGMSVANDLAIVETEPPNGRRSEQSFVRRLLSLQIYSWSNFI